MIKKEIGLEQFPEFVQGKARLTSLEQQIGTLRTDMDRITAKLVTSKNGSLERKTLTETLHQQEEAIANLEEMLPEQRREFRDRVCGPLSLRVCESLRPEYVALARELFDAAQNFARARRKEQEFINNLEAQGVSAGSMTRAVCPRVDAELLDFFCKEVLAAYPEVAR